MEHSSCPFNSELVTLQPAPALCIRARCAMNGIGELFNEGFPAILSELSRQGVSPGGPPYAFYSNIGPEELDVEFGFPLDAPIESGERIGKGETPGGRAVSSLFIGPYSEIGPAYDAMLKWIDDNGHEANGEACEIYLDNPAETPPEQLRTRVHLFLREA